MNIYVIQVNEGKDDKNGIYCSYSSYYLITEHKFREITEHEYYRLQDKGIETFPYFLSRFAIPHIEKARKKEQKKANKLVNKRNEEI